MTELTIKEAIRLGIEAHKAGKVQEADKYYTAIIKANPKHPDANHNMGVLAVGVGKVEAALPFFKTALEVNPNIEQFWLSYIDALIKLDRIADAKAVFDRANQQGVKGDGFDQIDEKLLLSKNASVVKNSNGQGPTKNQLEHLSSFYTDGQYQEALRVASNLILEFPRSVYLYNIIGAANQALGNLERSIDAYKNALAIKSDYAEAYNNIGTVLRKQAKQDEAVEAYNKALAINPDFAEVHNNLGFALKEQGKLNEAMGAYNKALAIKPNYAEAHNNLGITFHQKGKFEEAINSYKKALSIKTDYAEAYNNMGVSFKELNKPEKAMEAYNSALEVKYDYAEAWLNGAELLEKWNRIEQLEVWLQKANKVFKDLSHDLLFFNALCNYRLKNYSDCNKLIGLTEFHQLSNEYKVPYLGLKVKLLHILEQYKLAFDTCNQMKLISTESQFYQKQSAEKYLDRLHSEVQELKSMSSTPQHKKHTFQPQKNPIFLIGFPRSGTTLMETILRTHSKIEVIDEQPIVENMAKFLDYKNISDLETMSDMQFRLARDRYFLELNKHQPLQKEKCLIDKQPINMTMVPLIQKVFPEARFILAMRHPLDTILSCWMTNFHPAYAVGNMLELKSIVNFYCLSMTILELSEKKLGLNIHEIKYENLVENMKLEISNLLNFLNLNWENSLSQYQATALSRGAIKTPSYSQVVEPLYKTATYRWQNYEQYLQKYHHKIEKWVQKFNYKISN